MTVSDGGNYRPTKSPSIPIVPYPRFSRNAVAAMQIRDGPSQPSMPDIPEFTFRCWFSLERWTSPISRFSPAHWQAIPRPSRRIPQRNYLSASKADRHSVPLTHRSDSTSFQEETALRSRSSSVGALVQRTQLTHSQQEDNAIAIPSVWSGHLAAHRLPGDQLTVQPTQPILGPPAMPQCVINL